MSISERDAFGHWISGFSAGEGSFDLSLAHEIRVASKIAVKSRFSIKLRDDDTGVVDLIQPYWRGVGSICFPKKRAGQEPGIAYTVAGIREVDDVVLPHFDRYPLRNRKQEDFLIWREGVRMHHEIASRDRCSRGYNKGQFPKWTADEHERYGAIAARLQARRVYPTIFQPPLIEHRESFGHWLSGFTDAEGHFGLRIMRPSSTKPFPACRFSIKLRDDDRPILYQIKDWFGCSVQFSTDPVRGGGAPALRLEIASVADLRNIVVPHFDRFQLRAKKRLEFDLWKQSVEHCYQVSLRKSVPKGPYSGHKCLKGNLPKWSEGDLALFSERLHELKALREYKPRIKP